MVVQEVYLGEELYSYPSTELGMLFWGPVYKRPIMKYPHQGNFDTACLIFFSLIFNIFIN